MGEFGEDAPVLGEGRPFLSATLPSGVDEIIKDKKLTFEEASRCLNTLGKDETGSRYAYLMLTAINSKLTDVSTILNFKHLLYIDLSGNYLNTDALQCLTAMPYLILLKAERNRIESAAIAPMQYLQVLDLNQNQIKQTHDINQPQLDCLELNYNDIYTTQFETAKLDNLKQLELRSNLLFDISGVYPKTLEKLYMAANKINVIQQEDLGKLSELQLLHLRDNNIQKLDGFTENLRKLKYLNLRNNKINKVSEFRKLQCLPNLETLIVSGNPLPGVVEGASERAGEDFGEDGRKRDVIVVCLLVLMPQLKRINKQVITLEDRMEAEDIGDELLEGLLEEENNIETAEATTTDLTTDYKTETESENEEG